MNTQTESFTQICYLLLNIFRFHDFKSSHESFNEIFGECFLAVRTDSTKSFRLFIFNFGARKSQIAMIRWILWMSRDWFILFWDLLGNLDHFFCWDLKWKLTNLLIFLLYLNIKEFLFYFSLQNIFLHFDFYCFGNFILSFFIPLSFLSFFFYLSLLVFLHFVIFLSILSFLSFFLFLLFQFFYFIKLKRVFFISLTEVVIPLPQLFDIFWHFVVQKSERIEISLSVIDDITDIDTVFLRLIIISHPQKRDVNFCR